MDIVKNNKAIALFMGALLKGQTSIVRDDNGIWVPSHGIYRHDTIELGRGKILRYHDSWDWLIPVIDKATSQENYHRYIYETTGNFCEGGIEINTHSIEATYKNVVHFINWLKLNPPPTT